ncbi:MAG: alcohol dehydrogenase catalytic domain-containing protein, partial [Planctomycetes bacterium]|nr:alcohol dehydrogenase catalytic domain-containing protein [Planctomycetota bacterium]
MKGLVVTAGHALELREIGDPRIGPYEALVRIRACGICGTTDRELIKGTQPYHAAYPCLLGHEAVGQVVETGTRVRSFRAGDWVTRPVGIWPGESRDGLASAWGGFATLGVVRDRVAMQADGDASLAGDYTALRQNRIAAPFYLQALGENFGIGNLGRQDPYPADYFTVTNPAYTSAPTNTA